MQTSISKNASSTLDDKVSTPHDSKVSQNTTGLDFASAINPKAVANMIETARHSLEKWNADDEQTKRNRLGKKIKVEVRSFPTAAKWKLSGTKEVHFQAGNDVFATDELRALIELTRLWVEEPLEQEDGIAVGHGGQDQRGKGIEQTEFLQYQEI